MRGRQVDTIDIPADEQGSKTFKIIFRDEDNELTAPATMEWSLMAEDGTIINSRYKVSVESPASTTYITIYGDDLQILDDNNVYENRVLLISGTYNSTYGTGLPFNKEIRFPVRNLLLIALALYISAAEQVFTNDYVETVDVES